MIFQTISSVRSNSLGMKYLRFALSGCKDKGSTKYRFVAKFQFFTWSQIICKVDNKLRSQQLEVLQ